MRISARGSSPTSSDRASSSSTFVKDLGIALAEAKRMGLCLPGLALANQLYLSLAAHGHGRAGTQALQLALAEMSERRLARPLDLTASGRVGYNFPEFAADA